MIWHLQRLANLREQGEIDNFSIHFKPSSQYIGGDNGEYYRIGTTCWYVRLDIDDYLPTIPADTIHEAAMKAVEVAEAEIKERQERAGGGDSRGDDPGIATGEDTIDVRVKTVPGQEGTPKPRLVNDTRGGGQK